MTEFVQEQGIPEITVENIPLAYRLAHLGIDTSAVYPKVTAQTIADELGIDSNLVRRPLQKLDIETEMLLHERQQEYFEYYPYYMIDFIREERAWRDWYLTLPHRLNTNQVAEAVGRSYGWTAKTLTALYPDVRQQKKGHKSRFYPRSSAEKLRNMTFATPPDENWPTMPRLEEFTGRDREWILNRIAQTSIRPEIRRQAVTGREFPHYPPDTFDVLQEAMEQRAKPAGDWLTVRAMAAILERSENWVWPRLEATYLSLGEPRLDDMGVERIHYPPSVLEGLSAESAEVKSLKPAGDWVTISTLETRLGTHAVTLSRIMQQIEIESEIRVDILGRPRLHFSPSTEERLAKKVLEIYGYPEADGWVTFTIAQKIIGRSALWIREQLDERGVVPEIRLDKSRHPLPHYDPDTIQAIKEYGDTLEPGTMVSIVDIIERTGKTRPWVVLRLAILNVEPVKRFSKRNKLIDHYPETVIEDVLAI